jgi:trimethylamine:corrinoid methyltransferase-like protein
MIASPEKLLLDAESVSYVKRLLRPLDFSEERAAGGVIKDVGPRGSYILEAHTLRHYKDEFYDSAVFDRQPYNAAGEAESCRAKANKKAREIIKTHEPKKMEKSLDRRLRKYCAGYGLEEFVKNRFIL